MIMRKRYTRSSAFTSQRRVYRKCSRPVNSFSKVMGEVADAWSTNSTILGVRRSDSFSTRSMTMREACLGSTKPMRRPATLSVRVITEASTPDDVLACWCCRAACSFRAKTEMLDLSKVASSSSSATSFRRPLRQVQQYHAEHTDSGHRMQQQVRAAAMRSSRLRSSSSNTSSASFTTPCPMAFADFVSTVPLAWAPLYRASALATSSALASPSNALAFLRCLSWESVARRYRSKCAAATDVFRNDLYTSASRMSSSSRGVGWLLYGMAPDAAARLAPSVSNAGRRRRRSALELSMALACAAATMLVPDDGTATATSALAAPSRSTFTSGASSTLPSPSSAVACAAELVNCLPLAWLRCVFAFFLFSSSSSSEDEEDEELSAGSSETRFRTMGNSYCRWRSKYSASWKVRPCAGPMEAPCSRGRPVWKGWYSGTCRWYRMSSITATPTNPATKR